jgi:phosphatidylglycerophosphatase A
MGISAASWLAGRAEQIFGEQDNQRIVIDEVMGLLVTMAAVPLTWQYLLAGVVLFRIFDVLKPPPIRLIERTVKGGYGVVFDDVLAGIYAQISLRIVLYVFFTL